MLQNLVELSYTNRIKEMNSPTDCPIKLIEAPIPKYSVSSIVITQASTDMSYIAKQKIITKAIPVNFKISKSFSHWSILVEALKNIALINI